MVSPKQYKQTRLCLLECDVVSSRAQELPF